MAIDVRAAVIEDMPALTEIYNHYILSSPVTFDLEPWTVEQRRDWFGHYAPSGRHRLFVACDGDAAAGYASSGRYRDRAAYTTSVETSVYLGPSFTGRGIGRLLYEALFEALEQEDVHRAYAGITQPNVASVALHERFGFRQVAYFTEQGRKFDRWWDVAWFERPVG